MNKRFLYGGGLRFNFVKGENSLHSGIGIFRENEIWEEMDGQNLDVAFNKLNSYIGGEANLNDRIELNSILYFQTGFDDRIDKWRSRLNGFLEIKDRITRNLQLKLAMNGSFDRRPIIEITKFFYSIQLGFEFSFN